MKKVFIIAEAGVNHNGDIETAKKLIYTAKECGADAVKFQTFCPEKLVSKFAPKAEYQKLTTEEENENQLEMLKKLQLSTEEHLELMDCCKLNQIVFLSTAFDLDSLRFLENLELPLHKVPSGEITNLPYLIKMAQMKKPVILSCGMSTLEEVRNAVCLLKENGAPEITVLHCNTEYPTPFEDVNLRAMLTLQRELATEVGYSDHTPGIEVAVAAVALGASIIEKHFTLDHNMSGPDHRASLEPYELKAMISSIRRVEMALGDGEKKPSFSESKNKDVVRKSIVASYPIKKGERFTEENITVKRPGSGLSPLQWFDVLGRNAKRDFMEDELIEI